MLFSLYKRMHGAQRRRPNYAGIATGSGSPPGSGCYRCGSPPSSTGSPGLPGTQFDEACNVVRKHKGIVKNVTEFPKASRHSLKRQGGKLKRHGAVTLGRFEGKPAIDLPK